jgi:hypothetical protein
LSVRTAPVRLICGQAILALCIPSIGGKSRREDDRVVKRTGQKAGGQGGAELTVSVASAAMDQN